MLNKYGKVPFILRGDILQSDEAIVAVMAHEMHELRELTPWLREGRLTIDEFGSLTSPTNPGNLHRGMKTNYGVIPTKDQVAAATKWIRKNSVNVARSE